MGSFKEQEHWVDRVENHFADEIPEHLAWEQMAGRIRGKIDAYERSEKQKNTWLVLLCLFTLSLCFVSDDRVRMPQNSIVEKQNSIIATSTPIEIVSTNSHTEQEITTKQIVLKNKLTKSRKTLEVHTTKSISKVVVTSSKVNPSIFEHRLLENADEQGYLGKAVKIKELSAVPIEPLKMSLPIPPQFFNSKSQQSPWHFSIGGSSVQFQPNYKSEPQNAISPSLFEQNMASPQVSLRVHRKLSNHWEVSTGIQMQFLRTRVDFESADTVNLYRPNTIDTIFTNAFTGEQRFAYRDSIPGLQNYALRQHNQIQTIQIPVLLGYEWRKDKFGLTINGGINAHLRFKAKGKIILSGQEVAELSTVQNSDLRISALLEVQPTFYLNEQIAFFGQIGMEQHLTNWLNEDYSLSQHPKIQYVGFGIRRQLGK